jgi:hypothetical protein
MAAPLTLATDDLRKSHSVKLEVLHPPRKQKRPARPTRLLRIVLSGSDSRLCADAHSHGIGTLSRGGAA